MPVSKPQPGTDRPTWDAYPQWLTQTCHVRSLKLERDRYELVAKKIQVDVSEAPFWNRLLSELRELDDAYFASTGYRLFANAESPTLARKPWESILQKSYRKNVSENQDWPDSPEVEWLTPANWLGRINDVVRTVLVVKYLDGVDFVVKAIRNIAESEGLGFRADLEAKDEGYYAAHTYIEIEVEIPSTSWDTELVSIELEIQVTTQLQEVIRKLTHRDYVRRRVSERVSEVPWQWDYASEDFVPNYLGHILHYVEGMIMDVRQRQGGN